MSVTAEVRFSLLASRAKLAVRREATSSVVAARKDWREDRREDSVFSSLWRGWTGRREWPEKRLESCH